MKKIFALLLMLALMLCAAGALAETKDCAQHDWGPWQADNTVNWYCGTAQAQFRVCRLCGSRELGYGPIREHSFGSWTTTKEPTCKENGEQSRTCSRCHTTETRSMAKLNHSYGEWTVLDEATCTQPGRDRRICRHCYNIETRPVEAKGHPQTDAILSQTCAGTRYGCPVCLQVLEEVVTGKDCERTDVFLGIDRLELAACFGCPVCGTVYSKVDLSGLKESDWTEWTWNGNGTHSRHVRENPAIVETEGCYQAHDGDALCGACQGIYFYSGECVALTDITMLSTLEHTNDELYESTILCVIPAGATYYVTANADFPSVIYNGMSGYIYFTELNFVVSGECVALTDITMLSTLEHTNDELYESTILCVIPAGAIYHVTSDTGDFATVTYNGMTGYIASHEVNYVDQSVPHWLDWEYNGNGTHSRFQKEDPSVVQTEPCYLAKEGDTTCGACHAPYIRSGACVALTDITMLSTLEHTNDELYESTILCVIPAGAAFYVTENNDFATITYNGMEGYIYSGNINFVDAQ